MYQHEIKYASDKILEILEVDINTLSKVKYEELGHFLEALSAVHYSKGHDDGYSFYAGYTVK